jgi:ribosomal protein L6P/L9E
MKYHGESGDESITPHLVGDLIKGIKMKGHRIKIKLNMVSFRIKIRNENIYFKMIYYFH